MIRFFPLALILSLLLFSLSGTAQADPRGQTSLGLQYHGWQADTLYPFTGSEFLVPYSVSYAVNPNFYLSGQTTLATGSYTDSIAGKETLNMTALTASVVTTDLYFKGFGVPNMLEFSMILPTGDPSWESKQVASNVPAMFVNSRYYSEGFGISALYGLSFPAGETVEYGVSAGYSYAGPYDPNFGYLNGSQLKMGDSIFLAFNRTETFAGNKSSIIRLNTMAFLPTQENGLTNFQLGPNGGASYGFYDPAGLSWTAAAQIYTLAQRYYFDSNGKVLYGLEPHGSSGERFSLAPSYAFGNFNLGGQIQFVLVNGYPTQDYNALYNGGGLVIGLTPSYHWDLDAGSALNFTGGYDFITAFKASTGYTDDIRYHHWTLGANYEIKIY
jgi:hypothetical protein